MSRIVSSSVLGHQKVLFFLPTSYPKEGYLILTAHEPVVLDRRRTRPKPGDYSGLVHRIEKLTGILVGDHDKKYRDFDEGKYLTKYSLLNHQAGVGVIMKQVGKARQRNDALIQLGCLSAILHDMGKLHEDCQIYRSRKVLSSEEREHLTDLHSVRSLEFAEQMMPLIRAEERTFLGQALPLIRYHHKPWMIGNGLLREIGYDLMMSDAFKAAQERRHDEGHGLLHALEEIETWDPCLRYPEHEPHQDLIGESKRAIIWLFGLQPNLSGEPNPFAQPDA